MSTQTIAERIAAVRDEIPAILRTLDAAAASNPGVQRAVNVLRRFQTLPDPPRRIGRIHVDYSARPSLTGMARVLDFRDEITAVAEAMADIDHEFPEWTQEFDDLFDLLWNI